MAARILRALRLHPAEQAHLARLVAVRAMIEPLLRAMPLPRLASRLGIAFAGDSAAPLPKLGSSALSPADLRALAAVARLTAHGRNAERRCLRHALLAGYALRRHAPALRIGVARRDGAMTAHAWLEMLGGRIDVDAATEYLPLRSPRTP